MIPLSRMDEMIAYQMSDTPLEDLAEKEISYEEQEVEVLASLDERIQQSTAVLQQLLQEVRSVVPKADMLTKSSELLKENREKISAVLTKATQVLHEERMHNQRLRAQLYSLKQRKKNDEERVNVFINTTRDKIISTIGKKS